MQSQISWKDLLCLRFRLGVFAPSTPLPLSASLAPSARDGEQRACRRGFVGSRVKYLLIPVQLSAPRTYTPTSAISGQRLTLVESGITSVPHTLDEPHVIKRTRMILQMRGRSESIERTGSNRSYEIQREVKGERCDDMPKAPSCI